MSEKMKAAWTKGVVLVWLSLAILVGGCAEMPDPSAFAAVGETCKAQGKVMKLHITNGSITAECENP